MKWPRVKKSSTVGSPMRSSSPTKPSRIGYLSTVSSSSSTFDSFKQGLAELGYLEGRDIVIESRFAEGRYERYPQLIAELLERDVELIAVLGAVTARAVRKAAPKAVTVFAVVVDPVADGVVESMEQPGEYVTGATTFDPLQAGKQLQLLKTVFPELARVALLGDEGVSEALISSNERQARALGLQTLRHRVTGSTPDLETVLACVKQEQADALLVLEEPSVVIHANRIAALAASHRIPTLFAPTWADAGGLIGFGTSLTQAMRCLSTYVDKILRGARPGTLAVQAVTQYELILNLKTAVDIGVSFPAAVLQRANRVIQ
jgi:putative tryptophan/tyrosine transport system substrate-binding protein